MTTHTHRARERERGRRKQNGGKMTLATCVLVKKNNRDSQNLSCDLTLSATSQHMHVPNLWRCRTKTRSRVQATDASTCGCDKSCTITSASPQNIEECPRPHCGPRAMRGHSLAVSMLISIGGNTRVHCFQIRSRWPCRRSGKLNTLRD